MEDTTQAGAVGQESPEQEDEAAREDESTAQEANMEETVSDDSSIEDDVTSAADTVHIQVARHAELGPYLTDAEGRALYLFKADTSRSSTCYEQCAEVWPPVLTQAAPHAADSTVQERLLGTVQRRDGQMQVTYNDWPLYYYAKDTGADQTKGQDVMGFGAEWYLVAPAGHEVHAEAKGEKE
jgi:predicted lipoprotein with Yx(FWY)xxD motif